MRARAIAAVGTTVTTGAASSAVVLPVMANGVRATRHRVMAVGNAYIKFGASGVTVTTNDVMLGANMSEDFDTGGHTHFAHLQETAGTKMNVTPLEG